MISTLSRLLVLIILCWLDRGQTNPVIELEEEQREQVTILPYTFDLNPSTHHLQTSWEVSGASVSSICAFGTVSMMEVGFTGKTEELSSGNSWAVTCQPSYDSSNSNNKMEVEVDVTKFKVQPFRSYKVCISLDDYEMNWLAEPVCTHLFSFEKYVPYNPDTEPEKTSSKDETDIKDETLVKDEIIEAAIESDIEDKTVEIESVLKHQLSNIEHFVRDDFKAQYNEITKEIVEEFELEEKMLNSGVERSARVSVTSAICILLSRTFLLNML